MEEFVARPSRIRILLLLLASLGFVAIGFWMSGLTGEPPQSRRYSPELVRIIAWFAIGLFGFFAFFAARRLFDNREQVRIGPNGIHWIQWSDETIPWGEIERVGIWSMNRQRCICLSLRHPERYPGRGLAARLAGANRAMTGADVAITLSGTDRSFDEAWAAIERFHPDAAAA